MRTSFVALVLLSVFGCAGRASDVPPPVVTEEDAGDSGPIPVDSGVASTDEPDGGAADAGAGDAGLPDAGTHAVFVAFGHGGWTATSCDRGRTWRVRQFSDSRDDHGEWSSFAGLAFGNQRFVASTGWGADGHLLTSPDGLAWTETPLTSWTAATVFAGSDFSVYGAQRWRSATADSWSTSNSSLPPGVHQVRQMRGFPGGLLVAAVETQYGTEHSLGAWLIVSQDDGLTWAEGIGAVAGCAQTAHYYGDIAMLDSTLIAGAGSGDLCRSVDRGATWTHVGNVFNTTISHLFAGAQGFSAIVAGDLWNSPTGAQWTRVGAIGPSGQRLRTELSFGAQALGTLVATDGRLFFYSDDDGASWQPGTVQGAAGLSAAALHDLQVGFSSAPCP